MKTCPKCGESKPVDDFTRSKLNRDGRHSVCRTCRAAYRAENRRRIAERNREYQAENPQTRWESKYRERARKYGTTPVVESFTRGELVDRYGDQCFHCGGPFEELDHYPVAVALGGHHTLENCKPSCRSCNRTRTQAVVRARKAVDGTLALF